MDSSNFPYQITYVNLGISESELRKKYKEDSFLNNIPLRKFDDIAVGLPGAIVKKYSLSSGCRHPFFQYSYRGWSLGTTVSKIKDELRKSMVD